MANSEFRIINGYWKQSNDRGETWFGAETEFAKATDREIQNQDGEQYNANNEFQTIG
tara:strand:- start:1403 stop:1573 length:171 start_codon:yes stop_codon:yes gene_type:complete